MSSQSIEQLTEQPIAFHAAAKKVAAAAVAYETWPVAEVAALFALPFNDLLWRAQQVHREHFNANEIELATLLSIKTGGCPEDCSYCPQAARYDTGVEAKKILGIDTVLDAARQAKANGATRFCMGAAWRGPSQVGPRQWERVLEMVRRVRGLGMEVCTTLGMLSPAQAAQLREAGLTAYNHNVDTSPEFYAKVSPSLIHI